MRTRFRGWIWLLFLSCFSAITQQNGGAGQSGAPASGGSNHNIALDVFVADTSGRPIPGLQQQDFTLFDNKQPQKIISFHAVEGATAKPDPPVEVILVVDEVNTSFTSIGIEREQIEKFLGRNSGELVRPVSILLVSDLGTTVVDAPSRDGKALIASLNQNNSPLRISRQTQGFYGAVDRIGLSLSALESLASYETPRPGRKLVIWISPGWPLLSGPDEWITSKDRQYIFNSIVSVSDQLRRARITLYNVDPSGLNDAVGVRTLYYKNFLKGVRTAQSVETGNLALQVFAYQSGGRVLYSSNDIASEIAACIAEANVFYVLSFNGAAGDGPHEYHALDVKIDKPGLMARTRLGYYAQPEYPGHLAPKLAVPAATPNQ